jgi:hypothetical protein
MVQGSSGSAVATLATAATLQELVAASQACGVCQAELADSDVRLECTSQPNCQREYHLLCVGDWFGHLYRAKDLSIPQPKDSKWRCMLCSDVCAVCAPATRFGPNEPFYAAAAVGQKPTSAGEDTRYVFIAIIVSM